LNIKNNEIISLSNISKNMVSITIEEDNPIVHLFKELNILGDIVNEEDAIVMYLNEYMTIKISPIYKFKELFYTLKFKNKFRDLYYLKVLEPKIRKHYSPENLNTLLNSMKDENNQEEFNNLLACW
jgi:hypothetical protein